jgi:hypothetical protein
VQQRTSHGLASPSTNRITYNALCLRQLAYSNAYALLLLLLLLAGMAVGP